jgi:hypothetical protein
MAENTLSGAAASVSGFLGGLIDKATPVVNQVLAYQTAKKSGGSASPATPAPATPSAATDWRGTVATGTGVTSKPWFWPVVAIGGAVLIVGGFFFLRGSGRKG